MIPEKVIATEAAVELIQKLKEENGNIIFYQSGGCCDGSVPFCYLAEDFKIGENDLLLGQIGGVNFYIHKAQYEYWKFMQLIINAIEGNGSEYSLEYGMGKHFVVESRIFSDEEAHQLGLI